MAAQLIVAFAALVVMASAGHIAGPHGGHSVSSRKQDDYGNYAFNYQVTDGAGASNGRWEAGNGHGGVVGSYNIKDIDGRARTVDYVADKAGFRAKIKTNEPGTAHSLPAAAVYDSPYLGHVAHGVAHSHNIPVAQTTFLAPAVAHGHRHGGYGHGQGHGGYGHGHVGYGYGHGVQGHGHGVQEHGGYGHGHGEYGHGHSGYGHGFEKIY